MYMQNYDKFILIGDFNAEEELFGNFMDLYNLVNKRLVSSRLKIRHVLTFSSQIVAGLFKKLMRSRRVYQIDIK